MFVARVFAVSLGVSLGLACAEPARERPLTSPSYGTISPDGGGPGDADQPGDPLSSSDSGPGDSPTAGDSMTGGDTSVVTDLPAHITGFGVPYDLAGRAADGGEVWLDISINDRVALGTDWRLMMATYTYVVEQLRGSQLPWSIADGEILRFHGPGYTGGTDLSLTDNNADRWDVRGSETFGLNIKHGFLWLEDAAGQMIDGVVYETGRSEGDWLGGAAAAALQAGVTGGLWDSTARTGAFVLPDADVEYGRLRQPGLDGGQAADWEARGRALPDYYAEASGKTGVALKVALNMIIRGHLVVPYADVASALRVTDRDPNEPTHVIQFYTGQSTENDFNKEHIWAKSHGGFDADSQAGYSDLHHLRPTRPDVNSARWHLDFDEGGELYSDSGCRRVVDLSWEPRDAVKGDVARMIFYMAVRYEGGESNMPDLELVEAIPSLLDSQGLPDNYQHVSTPRFGRLSTLLDWHVQDPPDEEERRRNEVIFTDFQGNRNPFIDHPEWVAELWGGPAWPGN